MYFPSASPRAPRFPRSRHLRLCGAITVVYGKLVCGYSCLLVLPRGKVARVVVKIPPRRLFARYFFRSVLYSEEILRMYVESVQMRRTIQRALSQSYVNSLDLGICYLIFSRKVFFRKYLCCKSPLGNCSTLYTIFALCFSAKQSEMFQADDGGGYSEE